MTKRSPHEAILFASKFGFPTSRTDGTSGIYMHDLDIAHSRLPSWDPYDLDLAHTFA